MINILDNNSLIYLESNGLYVEARHECFITDEVKSEFLIAKRQETYLTKCIFLPITVDLSFYLREYKRVLNVYSLLSFYNLKGTGDVSILATACALAATSSQTNSLFPNINIVTNDAKLIKAIKKEVLSNSIMTTQVVEDWSKLFNQLLVT